MSIRWLLGLALGLSGLGCAVTATDEPVGEGAEQSTSQLANDPCATVRCMSGTHCESKGKLAECVADPINPCAAVLCLEGHQCVVQGKRAKCVQVTCTADQCGPALGLPNTLCPDGTTMAGPTGQCLYSPSGCAWEVISCP